MRVLIVSKVGSQTVFDENSLPVIARLSSTTVEIAGCGPTLPISTTPPAAVQRNAGPVEDKLPTTMLPSPDMLVTPVPVLPVPKSTKTGRCFFSEPSPPWTGKRLRGAQALWA
jgi:hypothetical protein